MQNVMRTVMIRYSSLPHYTTKCENECEGIKQGGVLNIVRHEVELKTPVSKIPEFLDTFENRFRIYGFL